MQSNFNFETCPIDQVDCLISGFVFANDYMPTILVLGIEEKESIERYFRANENEPKFSEVANKFFLEGKFLGLEIIENISLRSFSVM